MPKLDSHAAPASFQSTRWSLVLAAGQADSPQSAEALEQLCRAYWNPLYAHVRRQGCREADAQDLVQDFFARLLSRRFLGLADAQRGRFRTFLLSSFKHFLINDWERRQAARRGGGLEPVPIHEDGAEERLAAESDGLAGSELFDQDWAATLVEQTLAELHAEYTAAGKAILFEKLKPFVGAGAAAVPSHETVAAELGLAVGAVRVAVHRLRNRYRERLRGAVAHTVASPAEVDDELRHLINIIRAA